MFNWNIVAVREVLAAERLRWWQASEIEMHRFLEDGSEVVIVIPPLVDPLPPRPFHWAGAWMPGSMDPGRV